MSTPPSTIEKVAITTEFDVEVPVQKQKGNSREIKLSTVRTYDLLLLAINQDRDHDYHDSRVKASPIELLYLLILFFLWSFTAFLTLNQVIPETSDSFILKKKIDHIPSLLSFVNRVKLEEVQERTATQP